MLFYRHQAPGDSSDESGELSSVDLSLSASCKNQVIAVGFIVNFEKYDDGKRLKECKAICDVKENSVANSLIAFPAGRSVVVSAMHKAHAQEEFDEKSGKVEVEGNGGEGRR